MEIPFWKMHGAANDFILVDDRNETFPTGDPSWLAAVSARRTGVGSDGVILIQPSSTANFRMRFFNPDGGEAEMCGNGARCVARLAHDLGVAGPRMEIETAAGVLGAEVCGEQVRLHMTEPTDLRLHEAIEVNGESWTYHFANTGVPHVVIQVEDVDGVDLNRLGPAVRRHERFAPAGTNVNVMAAADDGAVRVRTYERGVEAETLACGTGLVACAVVAGRLGIVAPPVQLIPSSGHRLEVGYEADGDGVRNVTLLGPAEHVCRGVLKYPRDGTT